MTVSGRRLPTTIAGPDGVQVRRWLPQAAQTLDELVLESVEHLHPWMPWAAEEPIGIAQRRAMLEQWEADWQAGGDVVMGIFCGEVPVGGCGLHRRIGPGALEIGYWVHPQHLQQGVATRATSLLINAAFTVPDVTHVEIHNDKANTASAGVPRKLRFILIDERPDAPAAPAEMGIEQRWRMHRDDWQSPVGSPQSGNQNAADSLNLVPLSRRLSSLAARSRSASLLSAPGRRRAEPALGGACSSGFDDSPSSMRGRADAIR